MSILFGPLSETMSSVSWRDCALAGENTAGADSAPAPAKAAVDLRKSRRRMEPSRCVLRHLRGSGSRVVPHAVGPPWYGCKRLIYRYLWWFQHFPRGRDGEPARWPDA